MPLTVIILAAGKGTRMKSAHPKVLQYLAGKPLLQHVFDTTATLNPSKTICVVGHGAAQIKQTFHQSKITWTEQSQQLGTGHAVQCAMAEIPQTGFSLILYGDVPCIQPKTLQALMHAAQGHDLALISLSSDNPFGYGRIVRQHGQICRIVEQKDLSAAEAHIHEINTGIYAVNNAKLHQWLPKLSPNNAQGEYYLTDIVALAAQEHVSIQSIEPQIGHFEVEGVNDRLQLAALERNFQRFQANNLMLEGLTLLDPTRFDLRGTLSFGSDVVIDANVIIEGNCQLGDNVRLGAGCLLRHATIGADSVIQPYTIIDQTTIGSQAHIGPFARLRPDTNLGNEVHVGNFVEIKNSTLNKGSKANHLSYIGDATIGERCNIGAGTITCNYDGANKHQTNLGDDVFVGSNSALVAPIEIKDGATIAAGSVITKLVEKQQLAIARGQQRNIANYIRPKKTLPN